MRGAEGLLALLQLSDSAFPTGTFAHSYGLEQLVRDGILPGPPAVEAYVRSVVRLQAGSGDARAVARAARAAADGDLAAVCTVDAALFASKAAEELRSASTTAGARLLREVTAHPEGVSGLVAPFLGEVSAGRTPGTHPVAWATVGTALGVDAESLTGAALFATANVLLQASMRLMPESHRDVQGALHRLRPEIAALAADATATAGLPFAAFHPLQEIASMRHRVAPVRMFAS